MKKFVCDIKKSSGRYGEEIFLGMRKTGRKKYAFCGSIKRIWTLQAVISCTAVYLCLNFSNGVWRPFSHVFLNSLKIPEFILDFINDNGNLKIIFYIVRIVFFVIFVLLMFVPFEMILKHETWKQAFNNSRRLVGKNFIKTVAQLLIWNFLLTFICYFVFLTMLLMLAFYAKLSQQGTVFFWFFFKRGEALYRLLKPMVIACGNLGLLLALFLGFYKKKVSALTRHSRKRYIFEFVKVFLVLLAMISVIEFIDSSVFEPFSWTTTKVIAHRAGGKFAPENTAAGIEKAILSGSDYAEIDVVQSGDGVLVLSHDDSIKRITGVDKNISERPFEELRHYDAGAYFGAQYQGEVFSTLEEILLQSKDKIKLMIELKSGQDDLKLADQTLDVIYSSRCAGRWNYYG